MVITNIAHADGDELSDYTVTGNFLNS